MKRNRNDIQPRNERFRRDQSFNLTVISDWDSRFAANFHPNDGLIFCSDVANECCAIANDAEVSDAAHNGHKRLVNSFACVVSNRRSRIELDDVSHWSPLSKKWFLKLRPRPSAA